MLAYHITTLRAAYKILKRGMRRNSCWFPEKVFPNKWSPILSDKLIEYINYKHNKKSEPLAVIKADIITDDDAVVNSLYDKYDPNPIEIRDFAKLADYLISKPYYPCPEILVKNRISKNRIYFECLLEELIKTSSVSSHESSGR